MLSAASARSPRGLVQLTLIALAAGAVVTPALGSEHPGDRMHEPTDLRIAQATATSLTLRWDADETAASYRVFEEGDLVGTTISPEFTLDGLECGRSYELAAQAVDVDGRRSERVRVTAASAPCAPPPDTRPAPPPGPASPPPPPQAHGTPEATAPAPSEPQPATAPEPIPPAPVRANVWQTAGVFVWHEGAVDPETLGQELKDNGFGWAAVQLHDGLSVDPVQEDWIRRFRAASGLPVGGWGVLRTEPVQEAQLAQSLLARYGLGFYIADAETEYKYSSDTGYSAVRYARSREFVDAFRAALPDLPAAVSSYCRADREDIEWQSWADAGFDFLPQAYVNDLGGYVTPAACTEGAAKWFPPDAVHPTIGAYASNDPAATPAEYAKLLQTAHTVGFSVYLAETQQKDPQGWNVLGQAITDLGIALPGGVPVAPNPTTTEPPQADWHGAGY